MASYDGDSSSSTTEEKYWATEDGKKLLDAFSERIHIFYDHLHNTGRMDLWQTSDRLFYGFDRKGTWGRSDVITFGGEQGENILLHDNHYRSLMQNVHTLVTGSRLALQGRAGNNDPSTAEQVTIFNQILDWYTRRGGLEDAEKRTAWGGLRHGEGFLYLGWDQNKGKYLGMGPHGVLHEGDMDIRNYLGYDVIRDPNSVLGQDERLPWVILRDPVNRWDQMALYHEVAEDIRRLPAANEVPDNQRPWRFNSSVKYQSDFINRYIFIHAPCPALPKGRLCYFAEDLLLLPPIDLPYDDVPIVGMFPHVEDGTPFGNSQFWDLMSLQSAYNAALSTEMTAHDRAGAGDYWVRTGDTLTADELAGGGRKMDSAEPPQLFRSDPISNHSQLLLTRLRQDMETIIGVNSVVRGNPEEAFKGNASGRSLALLQAMAVQYNSGAQASFARLSEKAGTILLQVLKRYAMTPRVLEIVGDDALHSVREWNKDSIKDVSGVIVEISNPALMTAQGRMDFAEHMADKGYIQNIEQYAMVAATGRAEPMFRNDRDQLILIRLENERMIRGEPIVVQAGDRHTWHIREHNCILNDPDRRLDPRIRQVLEEHNMEHARQRATLPTDYLASIGEPPYVPPDMGGMGGPMPPPAPPKGESNGKTPKELGGSINPNMEMTANNMPENPATGETVKVPGVNA